MLREVEEPVRCCLKPMTSQAKVKEPCPICMKRTSEQLDEIFGTRVYNGDDGTEPYAQKAIEENA